VLREELAVFVFLRYNRVIEGLRCVPSSTNQQSGNLTNQKSPFPTDWLNQKPRKRTNQKAGYKKKQPIDSIETKSSFYKK
jgi:hypothetical protein